MKGIYSNLAGKLNIALRFFAGQGGTMVANLLYGLLCVRLMPASEYAKYVVVFGIMGTLLILMDANFTGTLIPLVGERVDDKPLIRDYVASLRRLSTFAYLIVATGGVFFLPFMVRNRGWDKATVAGMVVSILVCSWFARMSGNYFPALMMRRDRDLWYKSQLIASFGTLGLLLIVYKLHWLGAFQAIWINIIGYGFGAFVLYYRSRQLLDGVGKPDVEKQKAIVRLALPNLPQAIFFAVQGQISLFLITYFGHTTGVASVGALGRLGAIFTIFLQANGLLVEPYFAKLPKEKLKLNYAAALAIGAVISISVMEFALHVPQLLLWALGPEYAGLQTEVKLAVAAGAVSCFSGILWGVHSARRFVYWWNVLFGIGLTLLTQIVFILKMDISTVRGVLMLNLATNVASLLVNVTAGAWGFIHGPREAERPVVITEEEREAEEVLRLKEAENNHIPTPPPTLVTEPEVVNRGD